MVPAVGSCEYLHRIKGVPRQPSPQTPAHSQPHRQRVYNMTGEN